MLTSKQMNDLFEEHRLGLTREKTELLAEFLKEYGEHADWEEWLTFLKKHAEVKGFGWVRSKLCSSPS